VEARARVVRCAAGGRHTGDGHASHAPAPL
jgi:hypothetical protein